MNKGTLYLIPTLLGQETADVIPQSSRQIIHKLTEFIVEQEKPARHFLKAIGYPLSLDELTLHPLSKHTPPEDTMSYLAAAEKGGDIGLLSDAGAPAVADPGAEMVKLAHLKNIRVVPLAGPSSILLALMSSGFNGQHFTFLGYLPIQQNERIKAIKQLETDAYRSHTTQIFMETPFRNQHMLKDIVANCKTDTSLCIACDLTLPTEFISTKTVSEWMQRLPDLHKRPTIFLIGS